MKDGAISSVSNSIVSSSCAPCQSVMTLAYPPLGLIGFFFCRSSAWVIFGFPMVSGAMIVFARRPPRPVGISRFADQWPFPVPRLMPHGDGLVWSSFVQTGCHGCRRGRRKGGKRERLTRHALYWVYAETVEICHGGPTEW